MWLCDSWSLPSLQYDRHIGQCGSGQYSQCRTGDHGSDPDRSRAAHSGHQPPGRRGLAAVSPSTLTYSWQWYGPRSIWARLFVCSCGAEIVSAPQSTSWGTRTEPASSTTFLNMSWTPLITNRPGWRTLRLQRISRSLKIAPTRTYTLTTTQSW